MADPWDAFGDDDDVDDGNSVPRNDNDPAVESLALWLTQYFVRERHLTGASLNKIRVATCSLYNNNHDDESWHVPLERRGFSVATKSHHGKKNRVDVLILQSQPTDEQCKEASFEATSRVMPGGLLIVPCELIVRYEQNSSLFKEDHWDARNPLPVPDEMNPDWMVLKKWSAGIQDETCPWLPAHYDVYAERRRVSAACVTLTSAEHEACVQNIEAGYTVLSPSIIVEAVKKLQTYGYCVIPELLDPTTSQKLGQSALGDLHEAAALLKQREGVDLMDPCNSTQEPASYLELSMREDLRMDLRHGPRLNVWRGTKGCQPWTMTALDDQKALAERYHCPDRFLRGHPVILEVVRRTMNPVDTTLSPGNWGRYNFGGRGPDGSFMDLRVGPVGAIVSLPGSADQALHADTPHLMETFDCLPAHYINVFTPGCAAHAGVGQTAFVHGSHRLSYTAVLEENVPANKNAANDNNRTRWVQELVRPSLDLGDVLLFDCRVLHFGLANTNAHGIERPLLYANMTQHWFQDPKNWDDRRPIFTNDTEGQDE